VVAGLIPTAYHKPQLFTIHYTSNSHWSGYLANSSSSNTYNTALGEYTEETLYSSACPTNYLVTWSGLGGWNTNTLGQAGTIESQGTQGINQNQGWTENLPAQTSIVTWPIYATVGQTFEAYVHYSGGVYSYYLYNFYTGQAFPVTVDYNVYDGSTADFIVERPALISGLPDLSNFRTMDYTYALANANGVGQYANDNVTMVDSSGHDMAVPSSLISGGVAFTDTQHTCS